MSNHEKDRETFININDGIFLISCGVCTITQLQSFKKIFTELEYSLYSVSPFIVNGLKTRYTRKFQQLQPLNFLEEPPYK